MSDIIAESNSKQCRNEIRKKAAVRSGFALALLTFTFGVYRYYEFQQYIKSVDFPEGSAFCGMPAVAAFFIVFVGTPLAGIAGAAIGWVTTLIYQSLLPTSRLEAEASD